MNKTNQQTVGNATSNDKILDVPSKMQNILMRMITKVKSLKV